LPEICIIVPCYNEAERLDEAAFTAMLEHEPGLWFLFVNDGSSDATVGVLERCHAKHSSRCQLLNLPVNRGKAEAVRAGVLHVCGGIAPDYIGYWDADLATPLAEIRAMRMILESGSAEFVLASRMKRMGADVRRKMLRHYFGRVFSTFASLLLRLPVYDSQCGAKLFRAKHWELFKEPFVSAWLFDIEVLARFRNQHGMDKTLEAVYEYPVRAWIEKGSSHVNPLYIFRLPIDLLRISMQYNRKRST
jgi:dolichyl-phosphate beta-glucosyltransferase